MKLGEFIIELGVVGNTKELKKALKDMKGAERIAKTRQKIEKQLGRSLKANEVGVIKTAYAIGDMVSGTLKMATAIGGAVLALDRMAQSMIRVNQSFIGFKSQTGMSIDKANEFVSALGLVSGTGKEGVLNDLTTLSQKIYRLRQFGEGSDIFAKLGFNPIGMDPDDIIKKVRDVGKAKGYNEQTYTTIADELGISRDWVQLWQMEDDFFNKVMTDSEGIQLSEEKRLELYKLGYENRLAHAKIEKEILQMQMKLLPLVNAIETVFAGILKIVNNFTSLSFEIIGIISGVLARLQPVQKLFLSIYKAVAKIPVFGKMFLPFVRMLGICGSRLLPIIGQLMIVWDIVKGIYEYLNGEPKGWFAKLLAWVGKKLGIENPEGEENQEATTPEPVNTQQLAEQFYRNSTTNMQNNFYNNPVPVGVIQGQLNTITASNLAIPV